MPPDRSTAPHEPAALPQNPQPDTTTVQAPGYEPPLFESPPSTTLSTHHHHLSHVHQRVCVPERNSPSSLHLYHLRVFNSTGSRCPGIVWLWQRSKVRQMRPRQNESRRSEVSSGCLVMLESETGRLSPRFAVSWESRTVGRCSGSSCWRPRRAFDLYRMLPLGRPRCILSAEIAHIGLQLCTRVLEHLLEYDVQGKPGHGGGGRWVCCLKQG
jgi:hypothetical protein